jgi:hypothetical protein
MLSRFSQLATNSADFHILSFNQTVCSEVTLFPAAPITISHSISNLSLQISSFKQSATDSVNPLYDRLWSADSLGSSYALRASQRSLFFHFIQYDCEFVAPKEVTNEQLEGDQ